MEDTTTTKTSKEVLQEMAQTLICANRLLDMTKADIAVQEQYRRNAETILNIFSAFESIYEVRINA